MTNSIRACLLPVARTAYPDVLLRRIYRETSTVAMVGASPTWNRPSYFVMRYLQRKGFRVIPVNPRATGAMILGEIVYPDLESIPEKVDVVDVFRRPEDVPSIAQSTVAIGARVLWLQLGIRSPEAATVAGISGVTTIEDHCMKIEYGRLSGELAWGGVNTRILSSRRALPVR
ncbi:MAG TPA: CoA-binding protein [Patescibacteria group bacterium]|nr:CoA-binding protein [Patescibacteria group bacterium]